MGIGSLRILGVANLYNHNAPLLKAGNHKVARIKFSTANNPGLVGMFLPTTMPVNDLTSNVVADSTGYLVFHPDIRPGGIKFLSPDSYLLGDINLNGAPFEIGDAVVLSQYLADPFNYPLNPIQMAASDCNQDGIPASVADLIYLLAVLNGTIPPPRAIPSPGSAELSIITEANSGKLVLRSDTPAGGVLIKLDHAGVALDNFAVPAGLRLKSSDRDGILTLLVYSEDSRTSITGQVIQYNISSGDPSGLRILSREISDIYGRLMKLDSR
jgi:hypothetical protein